MNFKQLDDQVSISDQFDMSEIAQLAQAGVQVLVCNRPEGETEDQPGSAEVQRAAAEQGIEFVAIPFARGQMQRSHCEEFAEILASGKRIHAYCRTGNRSCNLWAGTHCLQGDDKKALLDAAREAGFDISGVLVSMDAD